MRVVELLRASGHREIRATHRTTLEITRDTHVTERGDCIVAVNASKAATDLSDEFARLVKNKGTHVTLTIKVANLSDRITGRGNRRITLKHPTDLVIRKSSFVCSRTLMVGADKSASDLSRDLVRALRIPSSSVTLVVAAELEEE